MSGRCVRMNATPTSVGLRTHTVPITCISGCILNQLYLQLSAGQYYLLVLWQVVFNMKTVYSILGDIAHSMHENVKMSLLTFHNSFRNRVSQSDDYICIFSGRKYTPFFKLFLGQRPTFVLYS